MLKTILQKAAETPKGLSYLDNNMRIAFCSYKELLKSASCFLMGLQNSGLQPGDKVILSVDNNIEFVTSFWGCILGGIVPTLVQAPIFLTHHAAFEKLYHVWEILDKPAVIVSSQQLPKQLHQKQLFINNFLQYDFLYNNKACEKYHKGQENDTAFIQFSSGSTTLPKGVILSHKNILSNIHACKESLEISTSDSCLSWMPLYHDMGLIGFHLTPIYSKCNHLLIPTTVFAQKPLVWLKIVSEYKATITCMTNFAAALVLKNLDDSSYDLSCVRVILNGSEPINVKLLQAFISKMIKYQLAETAMLPVYGLAEATLAVTMPSLKENLVIERLNCEEFANHRAIRAQKNETKAIEIVSEGSAISKYEIRIVNDQDVILEDGMIGHIQVCGESISSGYYNNSIATDQMFCNQWLRTGDLGFIRNNYLFVTGRTKDLLFINGRNYYVHDLENIILQNNEFQSCKIAICGDHSSEGDQVILFMKVQDITKMAHLFSKISNYLKSQIGLSVAQMIPTMHSFPRTSSGKLQRYKLVEMYHQGIFCQEIETLKNVLHDEKEKKLPRTATEKILYKLWSVELATNEISIDDYFSDLGGKSYHAMKIMSQLNSYYNIVVTPDVFFQYSTISKLATYIDRHPAIISTNSNIFSG